MKKNKRILLIDQLNLFFRNYIVNPSLSTNGAPIGGLRGCVQSIQKIVRESKPDMIIVCWDGEGGSSKRKLLKKDYKGGRKPIRLNRGIRNLSPEEEMQNKIWQQTRLIEYFNHTPIMQFMFKGVEADDIIAYISQLGELSECEKLIVSSDKDFYQLLSGNTILYRPIQKQVLNQNSILEQFDIHPANFAMARAMAGDKTDNLEGIGGVGLKTVSKRFPFFKGEEPVTFQKLLDYSRVMSTETKVRTYEKVLEREDILRRNYQMMQLYAPSLGISDKNTIRETIRDSELLFNKTELIKMMMQDGFGEINFIELFQHFNKMCLDT